MYHKKTPSKYRYSFKLNSENVIGVTHTKYIIINEHIRKSLLKKVFLTTKHQLLSTKVKEACYGSIVRPVIEYANTAWSPHTKANIGLIEAVQQRATRSVTGNFPVLQKCYNHSDGFS